MLAALRCSCSVLVAAALLAWAPGAYADAPESEEGPEEVVQPPPEPGEGLPRSMAPDLRRGALLVSFGTGLFAPAYDTLPTLDLPTAFSPGVAFRGALGFGLSRHVSMEVAGSYGFLDPGESCTTCSGSSLNLGVALTYHLTQGIAFDPWASFGVNYRTMDLHIPGGRAADGSGSYSGWDFARIALGGTYYPVSFFGFGPYLEASFGGFRLGPDGRTESGVYSFIDFGVRVTFDPLRPGKLPPKTVAISY
ncbi:MAG TPA: hypothetical protein PK156_36120 [Polyangium sp.]|nr:hypothetical protein [Polyangium sp.]